MTEWIEPGYCNNSIGGKEYVEETISSSGRRILATFSWRSRREQYEHEQWQRQVLQPTTHVPGHGLQKLSAPHKLSQVLHTLHNWLRSQEMRALQQMRAQEIRAKKM